MYVTFCERNMKTLLTSIFCLAVLIVYSNTCAAEAIDTSAVKKLIELKNSSPLLTIVALDEQLLASDAGGLSMLQGRFKNTENLRSFYAALSDKDWKLLKQCEVLLSSLEGEFSRLKVQLTEITNVSLNDVKLYGVVGAGNTAATASPSNIVLGLEMICESDNKAKMRQILNNYMTHELVHVVQYRLTKRTDFRFNLLEISLLEGSADYISDMLLGDEYVLDDARNLYGDKNVATLMKSFESTMLTNHYRPWLYTPIETMPMDMGYWVGAKLAEAYIKNGGSLLSLLALEDASAIFAKSKS